MHEDSGLVYGACAIETYVRDEGVGMTPEKVKALFYGSVNRSSGTQSEKGAGIGLMLCYDMLITDGGNIRVESQEGLGTTMTFRVPEAGEKPKTIA